MTVAASFTVDYQQYLNEQGQAMHPLPAIEQHQLLALYKIMVLTRTFDSKAIALQRTGKLGTYPASYGQEAIGAVIGQVMQADDVLVPFYRDYAAQLQRGVTMTELYQYWGGDERGNCFAHNRHDLPISVPIGSQCLHAAGVAKALQLRNEPRVAVACCGDGATSEGDFYEAINVAGVWQLPVVFVINNNRWAISVPIAQQTACQTLAQKAIAAGFTGRQVDGNDVFALQQVFSQALEQARQGRGPTLIEALTYRLCDHTTADDATRYQSKAECEAAKKLEPIRRLRLYLESKQWWDQALEQQWLTECRQQVEQAVADYLTLTPQPVSAIFDYHYQHCPKDLIVQRQQALAEVENA